MQCPCATHIQFLLALATSLQLKERDKFKKEKQPEMGLCSKFIWALRRHPLLKQQKHCSYLLYF